jgi:hypothetical protein
VAGLTSGIELSLRRFDRRFPEFCPDGHELVARVVNFAAGWSRIASSFTDSVTPAIGFHEAPADPLILLMMGARNWLIGRGFVHLTQ